MEEAKKLAVKSPDHSRATTPIELPDMTGSNIVKLVRDRTPDFSKKGTSPISTSISPIAPTISICPPPSSPVVNQSKKTKAPTPFVKTPEPDLINLESTKSSPVLEKSSKINESLEQTPNNITKVAINVIKYPDSPNAGKSVSFMPDKCEEKVEVATIEQTETEKQSEPERTAFENDLMDVVSPTLSNDSELSPHENDEGKNGGDGSFKSGDSQSEDEEIARIVGKEDEKQSGDEEGSSTDGVVKSTPDESEEKVFDIKYIHTRYIIYLI